MSLAVIFFFVIGVVLDGFIVGLLKIELYLYIEGMLEFELMFVLVQCNNVVLFYVLVEDLCVVYNFSDLQFFFDFYYVGVNVLCIEQDFYDMIVVYIVCV